MAFFQVEAMGVGVRFAVGHHRNPTAGFLFIPGCAIIVV
jgi:hypothetical protein